jgi:hypothetical protein
MHCVDDAVPGTFVLPTVQCGGGRDVLARLDGPSRGQHTVAEHLVFRLSSAGLLAILFG